MCATVDENREYGAGMRRPSPVGGGFDDSRTNVTASKLSPSLWCAIRAASTLSHGRSSMLDKVKMFAALGLVLLLAGCVPEPSLHPLFTQKDVLFDPSLVGTWGAVEGKDERAEANAVWTFEKSGENAYSLTRTADGKRGVYTVHLVQLGGYLFFDAEPNPPESALDGYLYLMPTHVFGRIALDGDTARVAFLDDEWVKQAADEDRLGVAHQDIEGTIVLTATTNELQDFALSYADGEEAFSNVVELRGEE